MMNILQILSAVEERDPEVFERLSTRRLAMRSFAGLGKKLTLTALPIALGGMFQKAYGQAGTPVVLDVLNFALTLEYLEYEFYQKGIDAPNLVPLGADRIALTSIRDNEQAHVNFLKKTITALGGTPVTKPTFDFTAGGTFADVYTNYTTFLAVAQAFEDTGVRAYKGQAGNLLMTGDILEAALNIHSVEARHASHIRTMRKLNHNAAVKPWITGKDSGIGAAVQPIYDGEELTTQANVNIVNIGGNTITADAASESFDEPLSKTQVLAIVDPFIV